MKKTFTRKVTKMKIHKKNESNQEIILTKSPEELEESKEDSKDSKDG